jgi:hypothetical protein
MKWWRFTKREKTQVFHPSPDDSEQRLQEARARNVESKQILIKTEQRGREVRVHVLEQKNIGTKNGFMAAILGSFQGR